MPTQCVVLGVQCPRPLGSCSPMCLLGMLYCVCGVLCHLAPDHRCARLVCCAAGAVSLATWLLSTSVPARCVLCCACGVLGLLAAVHRCVRSVCFIGCAVSLATWLLITGLQAWCVVLRLRCPCSLGCCSPVFQLSGLCCVCGVLGHLAPVNSVHTQILCKQCPSPLGSCSAVCAVDVFCSVCGVLGNLARVHRCLSSVCCVACAVCLAAWLVFTGVHARCVVCAVSLATWLLSTGVPARCVLLRVQCPWPVSPFLPVCLLGVLCCICDVLGYLVPVHRCACSVSCVACMVSLTNGLLFTGVHAR